MQRIWPSLLIATISLLTSGTQRGAEACELCDGPGTSFISLQNHIETWPLVAIAEPVETNAEGETLFRIQRVLKGARELRVGSEVTPRGKRAIMPNQLWLLLGVKPDMRIGSVLMLRLATESFLRAAPGLPPMSDPARRLLALVPWLKSEEPLVAASARKEFAEADYAAVKATAPFVDVDSLIRLLANPQAAASSRGTLFLLLGLNSRPAVRKRLATWMQDPAMQRARGFAALLAAWLMATGAPGLSPLRRLLIDAGTSRREQVGRALVKALGFHARNEDDLRPAQVQTELALLLRYASFFDATVDQLTELQAWAELDAVLTSYKQAAASKPAAREALGRFVKAHPSEDARVRFRALERARQGTGPERR